SLSTWLRDYLYIPLGGNRRGLAIACRNLMVTMLLGGLWHGANWTFVVWGGLHGAYLCVERLAGRLGPARPEWGPSGWQRGVGMVLTFHLVAFTWVFFRAPSLAAAATYLGRIVGWQPPAGIDPASWLSLRFVTLVAILLGLELVDFARRRDWDRLQAR